MLAKCKKCLLNEAGESKSLKLVEDYLNSLEQELKVTRDIYIKRLSMCKSCDNLISGMCIKCGCYVEIRAALKDKCCPDYDNKKW